MFDSPGSRVIALSAALALLAACGDPIGPGDPGLPLEELPRPLTLGEATVIERSNVFGIDLLREVLEADDRTNVVLSPLSASMVLAMTLNGAAGTTLDGMRTALRLEGLSHTEINDSYRGLTSLLTGLDPLVEVSIANSVWANERYSFYRAFFDAVTDHFGGRAESRDFGDPNTLREINAWVDRSTRGLIERILEEGEFDPGLALLLLNAVYFDGRWRAGFDPEDTGPGAFTRDDGSTVTVDMMHLTDVELPYGRTDDLVAVELPYGRGAYSMVVALPRGGTPREVLAGMDASGWDALVGSFEPRVLDGLALPRFVMEYDSFLNDALTDMGMGIAFTRQADFSDISPEPLCMDFVRQKTFIEVDEAGTRAAAVTAVGVRAVSFFGFQVDRPFLFAIRERLSGTILFIGVIGDPTVRDSGPAELPDPCDGRVWRGHADRG
ncbi:MAG: serpin family protein [Gemmatimonadota bacterium]|nr:serpin family protein [Gemmatimonadota bacterium]MDE2983114.1 serpin family protein [Gemmatimonadota bacterium]